jgi:hypothetical protein
MGPPMHSSHGLSSHTSIPSLLNPIVVNSFRVPLSVFPIVQNSLSSQPFFIHICICFLSYLHIDGLFCIK